MATAAPTAGLDARRSSARLTPPSEAANSGFTGSVAWSGTPIQIAVAGSCADQLLLRCTQVAH